MESAEGKLELSENPAPPKRSSIFKRLRRRFTLVFRRRHVRKRTKSESGVVEKEDHSPNAEDKAKLRLSLTAAEPKDESDEHEEPIQPLETNFRPPAKVPLFINDFTSELKQSLKLRSRKIEEGETSPTEAIKQIEVMRTLSCISDDFKTDVNIEVESKTFEEKLALFESQISGGSESLHDTLKRKKTDHGDNDEGEDKDEKEEENEGEDKSKEEYEHNKNDESEDKDKKEEKNDGEDKSKEECEDNRNDGSENKQERKNQEAVKNTREDECKERQEETNYDQSEEMKETKRNECEEKVVENVNDKKYDVSEEKKSVIVENKEKGKEVAHEVKDNERIIDIINRENEEEKEKEKDRGSLSKDTCSRSHISEEVKYSINVVKIHPNDHVVEEETTISEVNSEDYVLDVKDELGEDQVKDEQTMTNGNIYHDESKESKDNAPEEVNSASKEKDVRKTEEEFSESIFTEGTTADMQ